ncbi:MAG: phosphoglycerate kinase [Zestosphaera sp.]
MEFTEFPHIDGVELAKKKVLVRVDFNSPIGKDGTIMDDSRIRAHRTTIKKLMDAGAATVIITHQGRPGDDDFVTLEAHADRLREVVGADIKFINDVIGPAALKAIKELEGGEALLLDNVRLVSEELIEAEPEKQARAYLVRRLSPLFTHYVFDAFATAHRSQPSIVGFPVALPSLVGDVMKQELEALGKSLSGSETPRLFVLGGAKVRDTIKIVEFLTRKRAADRILTTGLVGLTFHVAKGGRAGKSLLKFLEEKGLTTLISMARRVVLSGAPVDTPYDVKVVKDDGRVVEEPINTADGVPVDVGSYTTLMFSEMIKEAAVVVMRGPAGYVEDPRFRAGTFELLKAALESNAHVVIGGGHLGSMLNEVGVVRERGVHVSTGGGALLIALSGETLPALKALEISYRKFFTGGSV